MAVAQGDGDSVGETSCVKPLLRQLNIPGCNPNKGWGSTWPSVSMLSH